MACWTQTADAEPTVLGIRSLLRNRGGSPAQAFEFTVDASTETVDDFRPGPDAVWGNGGVWPGKLGTLICLRSTAVR